MRSAFPHPVRTTGITGYRKFRPDRHTRATTSPTVRRLIIRQILFFLRRRARTPAAWKGRTSNKTHRGEHALHHDNQSTEKRSSECRFRETESKLSFRFAQRFPTILQLKRIFHEDTHVRQQQIPSFVRSKPNYWLLLACRR